MLPVPMGLPRSSELSTEILLEPDGARLMLRGELDMNGVLQTERAVQEAAAQAEDRLTVDLAELRFMDLFGARALLRAAGEVQTADRKVVIANPRRHVRRLFELITDRTRARGVESELIKQGSEAGAGSGPEGAGGGPAGSGGGGSSGGSSFGSASSRERR